MHQKLFFPVHIVLAGAFFVVYFFFFFLLTFKPQDNIKMAGTTPYCDLSVVKEAQLVA